MNRSDFAILKEQVHGRPLVYLDNAATSQKPRQVVEAIIEAYSTWNSNIHRGVHHLSQVATAHHEEARKAVAAFINARSSDEIVFTKGTTDSLNALAFSYGEAFVRISYHGRCSVRAKKPCCGIFLYGRTLRLI